MNKLILIASAAALLLGVATSASAENYKGKPTQTDNNAECLASKRDCVIDKYSRYSVAANEGGRNVFGNCSRSGNTATCEDEFGSKAEFKHDDKDRLVSVRHLR